MSDVLTFALPIVPGDASAAFDARTADVQRAIRFPATVAATTRIAVFATSDAAYAGGACAGFNAATFALTPAQWPAAGLGMVYLGELRGGTPADPSVGAQLPIPDATSAPYLVFVRIIGVAAANVEVAGSPAPGGASGGTATGVSTPGVAAVTGGTGVGITATAGDVNVAAAVGTINLAARNVTTAATNAGGAATANVAALGSTSASANRSATGTGTTATATTTATGVTSASIAGIATSTGGVATATMAADATGGAANAGDSATSDTGDAIVSTLATTTAGVGAARVNRAATSFGGAASGTTDAVGATANVSIAATSAAGLAQAHVFADAVGGNGDADARATSTTAHATCSRAAQGATTATANTTVQSGTGAGAADVSVTSTGAAASAATAATGVSASVDATVTSTAGAATSNVLVSAIGVLGDANANRSATSNAATAGSSVTVTGSTGAVADTSATTTTGAATATTTTSGASTSQNRSATSTAGAATATTTVTSTGGAGNTNVTVNATGGTASHTISLTSTGFVSCDTNLTADNTVLHDFSATATGGSTVSDTRTINTEDGGGIDRWVILNASGGVGGGDVNCDTTATATGAGVCETHVSMRSVAKGSLIDLDARNSGGGGAGSARVLLDTTTDGLFAVETGTAWPPTRRISVNSVGQIAIEPRAAGAGNTGILAFRELAVGGTNVVQLKAPDAIAADIEIVLPAALPVANLNGQVVSLSPAGVLAPVSPSIGSWCANTSLAGLGSGVAQYFGTHATLTLAAQAPYLLGLAGSLSRIAYSFLGNAANGAGQTVTITLEISTDNGATWGAVAGATSGALATNGAVPLAAVVAFAPVVRPAGAQVRAVATFSADLTAACTMMQVEAG